MAKIVGVHGIGHQFSGENSVAASWLPALRDGLARAGRLVDQVDHFRCAFYGDLFRPAGKSTLIPPLDASDLMDAWELEFLDLLWKEAAKTDPLVVSSVSRTKISTPASVQRALNALSQSTFFAGLAERALVFDLKQVRRYLREPEIRNAARERVCASIGLETRVVVAHSLGSVVAYEALCANPQWNIEVFVTIGSPLGIQNLIFNLLEPAPVDGVGQWPPGLRQWINIADLGDVVALEKRLSSRFGKGVVDHSVENGSRAHDASRYLTTREVGDAIARGL